MADPIQTDLGEIFSDAPVVQIYISDALGLAEAWTEELHLRLNRLDTFAAPEIDVAYLEWIYGEILHQDGDDFEIEDPKELQHKFVRIDISSADEVIQWFGVIEGEEQLPWGAQENNPTGIHLMTAFGLLRLLERTTIQSAQVKQGASTIEIQRGLTFNLESTRRDHDRMVNLHEVFERSNRTENPVVTGVGELPDVYVFSQEPRKSGFLWTAAQAVDYLLLYNAPEDADGNLLVEWRLTGQRDALNRQDLTVRTDGRTVKEAIDELLSRRRGVGYYCEYNTETKRVELIAFTLTDTDIYVVDDAGTINLPANENQKELDFEQAVDIEKALVRAVAVGEFDTLVVQGAFYTSTCTLSFNPINVQIMPGFTQDEADLYKAAASGVAGYDDLDPHGKYVINARTRASDWLRNVYKRFVLSPEWDQKTFDFDDHDIDYWVAPLFDEDGEPLQPLDAEDTTTAPEGREFWNSGIVFQRHMVLKDRYDYSAAKIEDGEYADGYDPEDEPEFLPPLVFAYTETVGEVDHYSQLDQMAANSFSEASGRRWSVHVIPLQMNGGFDLTVSGGPQHFLATDNFIDDTPDPPAAYDPTHDPEKMGGLNFQRFQATLTLQLDERVSETRTLRTPPAGRQNRIKYITIPDARCDYVVPQTVVAIKHELPVKTTSGGFVRDDRQRLKDIARVAAEWYSQDRQTLELTFRQVRKLFTLGWLITEFGNLQTLRDDLTKVNTVITRITYEFNTPVPKTTIETSYCDLDFS